MMPLALVPSTRPASRSVLLADEDSGGRRRLAHEFEHQGFDVHFSEDAKAAVDLALSLRPALVVFELRLKADSGLSMLAGLRPQLPTTRFVVLTSFGSVATAVRAIRLGAAGYLCKPANVEHVLAAASDSSIEGHAPLEVLPGADHEALQPMNLDQAIWEYIHQAIEMTGSVSGAARQLGLWRRSLKRMIDKYRPPEALATSTPTPLTPGRSPPRGMHPRSGLKAPGDLLLASTRSDP
jgi:two-component system response regulator RegA